MKVNVVLFLCMVIISTVFLYNLKSRKATSATVLEKADKVLVIKSKREMYLLRNGEILKKYKIALGDKPVGHKREEGDEKTPEGKYILDWRNSKSSCYKSIHISYPDKYDVKAAKQLKISPGGDVMIHGLHPSIRWLGSKHIFDDWTDGCIAVTNEEMNEIWKSVSNGTPIEIKK